MTARSYVLVSALTFLAVAAVCQAENIWSGTEKELYKSAIWEPNFGNIVIVRDGSDFKDKNDRLKEQLSDTDIFVAMVTCPGDKGGHGEVCTALSEHRYGVRSGDSDKMVAVDIPSDSQGGDTAYVLQALIGERLIHFNSYSELKIFTSQHSNLFVTFASNISSYEYVQLLKTWVSNSVPLALTTNSNTLPLSRRPAFGYTPPPLHLWCLLQYDDQWFTFNYIPVTQGNEEQKNKFNEDLFQFVDRLQYPIVAEYSDALQQQLGESNYHLVFVFPGLEEGLDLDSLIHTVSTFSYSDFVFIMAKRNTEVARTLFVTDQKRPQVAILPRSEQDGQITIEIESSDNMPVEVERLRGILENIAHENPRGEGRVEEDTTGPPPVSVVDPMFLSSLIDDKQSNIMVAFCKKDDRSCPGEPYDAMTSLMSPLQKSEFNNQVGSLVCHVAECDSTNDLTQFGFSSMPSYGLYNATKNKWYRMEKPLTAAYQLVAILVLSTGIDDLLGLDVSGTNPEPDFTSPIGFMERERSLLDEDDHFGLLAKTLSGVSLPKDARLTSVNFDDYISQRDKTVVVFYMSWCTRSKVFLNHVTAAYEKIDKAENVSLAVVVCDEWTDLCTRVGVFTYPTALLYTPHTLHAPTPLTTLDTPHILNALGLYPLDSDNQDQLVELTASSLPSLLRGDLDTTLVIWCDGHITSEKGNEFSLLAQKKKTDSLSFAWMDSSKHTDLLLAMLQTNQLSYPSVVVLQLAKGNVYQYVVEEGLTVDAFSKGLEAFLMGVFSGDIEPFSHLGKKDWPPLQPPVSFPSPDDEEEYTEYGDGEHPSTGQYDPPGTPNMPPPTYKHESDKPPPLHSTHSEL